MHVTSQICAYFGVLPAQYLLGCVIKQLFRNLNLDSDIPWHETILMPKIWKKFRNVQKPVSASDMKILKMNERSKKSKCKSHQMGAYNMQNDDGIPNLAYDIKSDNI